MSHSCSLAHHEQMQNDYPKCHNDTVLVSLTKMFTCPSHGAMHVPRVRITTPADCMQKLQWHIDMPHCKMPHYYSKCWSQCSRLAYNVR